MAGWMYKWQSFESGVQWGDLLPFDKESPSECERRAPGEEHDCYKGIIGKASKFIVQGKPVTELSIRNDKVQSGWQHEQGPNAVEVQMSFKQYKCDKLD